MKLFKKLAQGKDNEVGTKRHFEYLKEIAMSLAKVQR